MSRVVGPFLAAVLLSSTCWAQAPAFPGLAQPPRDNATLPTGTAMIRGHVYDASNGQPLRKAQVRATSPELRENRLAITDNNGAATNVTSPAALILQATTAIGDADALETSITTLAASNTTSGFSRPKNSRTAGASVRSSSACVRVIRLQ